MITAVDTSVLVDVFVADPAFGPRSQGALAACLAEGRVVASEIVWAELAAVFPSATTAQAAMDRLGVDFEPLDRVAALAAGDAWRAYKRRGGRRDRVIADFLIGAHAAARADRLLTRDRGFYRTYFTRLKVLDPA
ncbi:MAG: type II toxin-antitoxin system VapC family toxin, partial [Candidatus Rokubacteria bacterium]|nr:type II toxin-antitoxin system VapC family toxin [Candidatus Rokubacteria bacterium]